MSSGYQPLQQQQQQAQVTSQSPQSAEGELTGEDGKPAPHEAVIKSYAHQIFMSQQKALVSQSQPVFAMASSSSTTTVPQAGVPIQAATATPTSVPVAVTPAQAAQLQLQAQVQQMQQAQAQAAAHAQAQAQAAAQAQAIQMQQIQQMQMAASLGLTQPGLALQQQLMAQQQLIAQQQAAAQGLQQVIQLPNGQVVLANPGAAAAAAAPKSLSPRAHRGSPWPSFWASLCDAAKNSTRGQADPPPIRQAHLRGSDGERPAIQRRKVWSINART